MKRFILILFSVCFVMTGWAEQITREQALRQAQSFFSQNGKGGSLSAAETAMSKARKRSQQVPDYYYVFNAGEDQGYVIVSGDDRTAPILGYSYHGSFDVDKIPCNMAAWLQGYADQIKYIQEHPEVAVTRGDVPTHADISPMISTQWDQVSPYNDLLPTIGSKRCVTGCGPTAMAQIMNYHGAPASCPSIPGYTSTTNSLVCESLPATTFNWSNMSSDNAEVAKLMKYCAYAVHADFGVDGTSSSTDMICKAFTDYFGYGNGIATAFRQFYSDVDWDQLIYSELANGRPVFYSGQSAVSTIGGHFFILHGYTVQGGLGYYSVNWGWSGTDDGLFLLNVMDPSVFGSGNGFNYNQAAILGISTENVKIAENPVLTAADVYVGPANADPSISQSTEYVGTRDGSGNVEFALYLSYYSTLLYSYTFDLGYALMQDGAIIGSVYEFYPNCVFSGTGAGIGAYAYPFVLGAGLANGDYQIKLACKESGSDWQICKDADDHVISVRVADTNITFKVGALSPTPTPEVTEAELQELKGLYTAQKTAISNKITTLGSNDTKLAAVAQVLTQKKTALDSVTELISAIEDKLKSNYLTADQKKSYGDELDALKTKSTALTSQYNAAKQELTTLQSNSATMTATLNSLLSTVNTEEAAVASITTKEALDASKAKVAEITTQQSGCDVSAETTKVTALEKTASGISVSETQTALMTLEGNIDTTIEAAKKAEQDVKDKEKLEADKKTLQEAFDNLKTVLSAKQDVVAANEKSIAVLESAVKDAQNLTASAESEIAAIRESLKSDMLSTEKKTELEGKLKTLDNAKSAYADAVQALSDKLDDDKKSTEEQKVKLEEIEKTINSQIQSIKDISTTDDLTNAQTVEQNAATQLDGVNVAGIEKDLLSLKAELEKLSLTATLEGISSLEDEVSKAIADGKEEYEKQQAEKLAKAKEECQDAFQQLDEIIKSHQKKYDELKDIHEELKAKMKEIDEAIAKLKKQYADIEKTLDELIAKQTRADDDPIAKLQEGLKKLAENISLLEEQHQQIADQISELDTEIQQYSAVIETAKQTYSQLQSSLASATAIADVENLTTSVTKASDTLTSDGAIAHNLYAGHCSTVIDNLNILINNVNTVVKQANSLETGVQEAVTGIQRVTVDESEVVSRYDMKGNRVDSTYKGMQIIRLKNGKIIKMNVK